MIEIDHEDLYRRALAAYGMDYQLTVAVEELIELQKEICKLIRCEGNVTNLIEEMADVYIILAELKQFFAIGNDETDAIIRQKQIRLAQRISAKYEGLV